MKAREEKAIVETQLQAQRETIERLEREKDRVAASEQALQKQLSQYQQECFQAKSSAEVALAQIRQVKDEKTVQEKT
jgi:uncharacterized protein (UPF0335 family)